MNFYFKMKTLQPKSNLFSVLFILFGMVMGSYSMQVHAEGSEQFKPDTTKASAIMILNTQATFGTFAIKVHIKNSFS